MLVTWWVTLDAEIDRFIAPNGTNCFFPFHRSSFKTGPKHVDLIRHYVTQIPEEDFEGLNKKQTEKLINERVEADFNERVKYKILHSEPEPLT